MKQFIINANHIAEVIENLHSIKEYCKYQRVASVLIHVFAYNWNVHETESLLSEIQFELPQSVLIGCTSCGGISQGTLSEKKYLINVTVFESTIVEIMAYEFVNDEEVTNAEKICNDIDSIIDTAAVELFATVRNIDPQKFLENIHSQRKVPIFGAGVMGSNEKQEKAFLIYNQKIIHSGAVIVIYRGLDLHVTLEHASGWKPLGMEMQVTKADLRIVQEIDGKPAYDVYRRYLQIPRDGNFLINTLGFPFITQDRDVNVIRIPHACTDDDHLIFSADIKQNSKIRLTYDNPGIIFKEVEYCQEKMRQFAPQVIWLYNCVTRKLFWQNGINQELGLFQSIAPSSGFFCEGEFRTDSKGNLINHQCTLLLIGMREGSKQQITKNISEVSELKFNTDAAMLKRMATFIQTTSEELERVNQQLRIANMRLAHIAKTDELTQLFNRREIERRLNEVLASAREKNSSVALLMLDIDHFKRINDTYGHSAGDEVLKDVAAIIFSCIDQEHEESAGRWGGEEFLVILPNRSLNEAVVIAEKIRHEVSVYDFNIPLICRQTISIGVTTTNAMEDKKTTFRRVDEALYNSKKLGRNRVTVIKGRAKKYNTN